MQEPVFARVLTPQKAATYIGVARSSLYRLRENDPSFPQPIAISERRFAYVRSELDAWLDARVAERDLKNERPKLQAAT